VYRTGIEFLATSESRWGLIEECVLDEYMDSLSRETWCLPPEVPLRPVSPASRVREFCRRWLRWLLPLYGSPGAVMRGLPGLSLSPKDPEDVNPGLHLRPVVALQALTPNRHAVLSLIGGE
ncbi:MAG: hypothetical protein ACE5JU_24890, partial [Candidatus Binatia bacterium]